MGRTVQINHSGRHHELDKPNIVVSSSVIFSKIDLTNSALIICLVASSALSFHVIWIPFSPSDLNLSGCLHPHPSSVS